MNSDNLRNWNFETIKTENVTSFVSNLLAVW